MSPFILYMLKTSVCTGIFIVFYHLLLRRETFHLLNRFYLISSLILSFIIPAVKFSLVIPEMAAVNSMIIDAVNVYAAGGQIAGESLLMDPDSFISGLFFSGAAFITMLTVKRLVEIIVLVRKNRKPDSQAENIIMLPEKYPSFSFFRYIFISGAETSGDYVRHVIKHETAHADQLHSLDIIILQIIKIIQWFNPFVYILEKYLKEIHEYLADTAVTEQEGHTDGYELLLLSQAFGIKPGIINFFNASLIKKRLIMMTRPKSQSYRKIKYLSVLPLLAMILVFFNCSDDSSVDSTSVLKATDQTSPLPPPSSSTTDVSDDEPAYVFVQNTATFQGGSLETFVEWVASKIVYPEDAIADGVYGRVTVQFAVASSGKVTDVVVIRGADERLDDEAKRVILSSPYWKPATSEGRPVKQMFTIPVIFTLTK